MGSYRHRICSPNKKILMTLYGDLIATGLLATMIRDILVSAVLLALAIKFLRQSL